MKAFIKVSTGKGNIAYFVPDDVKRVVEIGTEQNGSETKKSLITFDDGTTLTSVDSAQKIIELIQGKEHQNKPVQSRS